MTPSPLDHIVPIQALLTFDQGWLAPFPAHAGEIHTGSGFGLGDVSYVAGVLVLIALVITLRVRAHSSGPDAISGERTAHLDSNGEFGVGPGQDVVPTTAPDSRPMPQSASSSSSTGANASIPATVQGSG